MATIEPLNSAMTYQAHGSLTVEYEKNRLQAA